MDKIYADGHEAHQHIVKRLFCLPWFPVDVRVFCVRPSSIGKRIANVIVGDGYTTLTNYLFINGSALHFE